MSRRGRIGAKVKNIKVGMVVITTKRVIMSEIGVTTVIATSIVLTKVI